MSLIKEFEDSDFPTKVRHLMDIKGFDTWEMAKQMEMSRQGFSMLLNGHIKMKVDTLKRLANVLGVDAKILL